MATDHLDLESSIIDQVLLGALGGYQLRCVRWAGDIYMAVDRPRLCVDT